MLKWGKLVPGGSLTGLLEGSATVTINLIVHMPVDPVVPILGVYSKGILTSVQKDLHCSIACNSEKWETT